MPKLAFARLHVRNEPVDERTGRNMLRGTDPQKCLRFIVGLPGRSTDKGLDETAIKPLSSARRANSCSPELFFVLAPGFGEALDDREVFKSGGVTREATLQASLLGQLSQQSPHDFAAACLWEQVGEPYIGWSRDRPDGRSHVVHQGHAQFG